LNRREVIAMWINKKRMEKLEKRIADLENGNQSQIKKYSDPEEGYECITNYMTGYSTIQFDVSALGWKKLENTSEWKNFQKLLFKIQKQAGRL
jgi:hypothetical protein